MRASEFIKAFGWEIAEKIIDDVPKKYMSCYYSTLCYDIKSKKYSNRFSPRESLLNIGWLHRLVFAYRLIKPFGGLDEAKEEYQARIQNNEPTYGLAKAISDVESCS